MDELELLGSPTPIPKRQTWLEITERLAKVAALVAIPIVIPVSLAIFSTQVQKNSQKETIDRDYVQLAVSVLEQKKNDLDPGLRDWAVDLLDEHSPTKFKPNVLTALKSGNISLPSSGPWPNLTALSPDHKFVADATPSGVLISDTSTGKVLSSFPIKSPVGTLRFSSDGKDLIIDTVDGNEAIWNVASGIVKHKINP